MLEWKQYRLFEFKRSDYGFLREVGIQPCVIGHPYSEPHGVQLRKDRMVRRISWKREPPLQLSLNFCGAGQGRAIMSATQVWERLLIGGVRDAEALAESNPLGITTVVTLSLGAVRKFAPGVNYIHLPVPEAHPVRVARFDRIIDTLYGEIRWGKVLLHSLAGVNRAPILAAAWINVVGCKRIDAALVDIGKLCKIIPNHILLESVKKAL